MNEADPRAEPALSIDLREYPKPPLAELRRLIRAALHREDADCVSDAELVMTELVTNAYDHADQPRRLHVWRLGEPVTVRIEVDDAGRDTLPVVGTSRLGSLRGRGLIMVTRLSQKWGVSLHRVGKTVWAEISCHLPQANPVPVT